MIGIYCISSVVVLAKAQVNLEMTDDLYTTVKPSVMIRGNTEDIVSLVINGQIQPLQNNQFRYQAKLPHQNQYHYFKLIGKTKKGQLFKLNHRIFRLSYEAEAIAVKSGSDLIRQSYISLGWTEMPVDSAWRTTIINESFKKGITSRRMLKQSLSYATVFYYHDNIIVLLPWCDFDAQIDTLSLQLAKMVYQLRYMDISSVSIMWFNRELATLEGQWKVSQLVSKRHKRDSREMAHSRRRRTLTDNEDVFSETKRRRRHVSTASEGQWQLDNRLLNTRKRSFVKMMTVKTFLQSPFMPTVNITAF